VKLNPSSTPNSWNIQSTKNHADDIKINPITTFTRIPFALEIWPWSPVNNRNPAQNNTATANINASPMTQFKPSWIVSDKASKPDLSCSGVAFM
jgi:hypothetical protein